MRIPRLAVLVLAVPFALSAQSLASRVGAVRSGNVVFHYNARPGVCGDGESFIRIGHSFMGSVSHYSRTAPCDFGPVQVRLTMLDGNVDYIETRVGRLHGGDATDLGEVSSNEAARYLLDIASRSSRTASSKAILGAVLADSATVWPTLLTIAKQQASRGSREEAMFWLSRYAANATAGRPNEPFDDDDSADEKEDLKEHAVFVLTQLPDHGTRELLDTAKNNKDPHVRSKALFWLGQSGDPRALELFEQILHG